MKCQGCGTSKETLRIVPSKLMRTKWNMCESCITQGFEPRWAIILTGRSEGMETIIEYIRKHKYVGDEITAKDIVS